MNQLGSSTAARLAWVALAVGMAGGFAPSAVPATAHHLQDGVASWYGGKFHGRQTASGEVYDKDGLTCAHRTLPFGTVLLVTNLDNGRRARLRVNDRGPFVRGRVLDCSEGAARELGFHGAGLARVRLDVLGQLPDPDDARLSSADRRRLRRLLRRAERRGSPVPSDAPLVPVDLEAGQFLIQVGAFAEEANAQRLADRLRAEGHEVRIVDSGSGLRRVRVGPMEGRSAAEATALRLRRAGLPTVVLRAETGSGATDRPTW